MKTTTQHKSKTKKSDNFKGTVGRKRITKTTSINVRTDQKLKHDTEQILDELGLNMTTAINAFLPCLANAG